MEFRLGLMVELVRFAAELDGDVGGERIRNRKEERERVPKTSEAPNAC